MLLLLLAACTGTPGSGGGAVADYRLSLVPVTPPDVNPFAEADRIDLLLDEGVGEPIRVALDVPASGESALAEDLPALEGTRVVVEVYAEGELVGWGRSAPVTASEGELEATVLVTVPDSLARFGPLPEEWWAGQGASLGEGRFVLLGGAGNRSTKKADRELDIMWTLDLGAPEPELAFIEAGTLPEYVDSDGNTKTGRRDFTLTELTAGDAGQYLLTGGSDNIGYKDGTAITADCRLFNPEDLSFSEPLPTRDALHTARANHTAAANQQGGVLVWGGYGAAPEGRFVDLQNGELYDPVSRSFSEVEGPRSGGDYLAGSIAVGLSPIGSDGVLVAGGMFTDGSGEWTVGGTSFAVGFTGDVTQHGDMEPVAAHALVTLETGEVLAFGGVEDDGELHDFSETIAATRRVQRFDPGAGTWESVGQLEFARAGLTATLVSERYVLIAGGAATWGPLELGEEALSCVELYDVESDTSRVIGDCSAGDAAGGLAARAQSPAALFDPEFGVIIAGGADGENGAGSTTTFYALPRD